MRRLRVLLTGLMPALLIMGVVFLGFSIVAGSFAQEGGPPAGEPALQGGTVPGGSLGSASDAEIWRAVRQGAQGNVSIPDRQAAVLIQSEGENWRAIRNGPLSVYSAWALLGIIIVLALFFAIRGRIKIESGRSAQTVERFNGLERFGHWLTAGSFIVLGLTGLNMLYGRYTLAWALDKVLPGDSGAAVFSWLTLMGKYAHNYLAFAFIVGLVLIFVLWVRHNLPDKTDLSWLAKAGGLFTKHSHPPAKKFNAGQKMIFWLVILGGLSISLSGIALLFPFQFAMFEPTFAVLNAIGFDLPTTVTPMLEMQLSQIWHAIVGVLLIVVIVAHIYIGSIGMEGAFDAMGSGMVDRNWAREHHSLWAKDLEGGTKTAAGDD